MQTQLSGGVYCPVTNWARYVPHKRSCGTLARASHAAEHLAGRGANAEALSMIAEPEQPLSELQLAMRWNGHYGLYKHVLNNPELADNEERISTFFAEQNEGNLGKLHRAMGQFELLRKGEATESVDNATALAELASVFPFNSPEKTLKEVLTILMPNAANLRAIGADQQAQLREIALRCPTDDGFGVNIARSALLSIDTIPQNYASECERMPMPAGVKEKQDMEPSILKEFKIFPNPNNGQMTLSYSLPKDESGMIEVIDLLGQRIFTQPLDKESSSANISLTGISDGIYLLRVEMNGKIMLSERLNVLRN